MKIALTTEYKRPRLPSSYYYYCYYYYYYYYYCCYCYYSSSNAQTAKPSYLAVTLPPSSATATCTR
eukprot:9440291-Heterocapsa_arctica.AAC.1